MASTKPPRPHKVFIDSSVLIAAAISSRGSARDLLTAGITLDEYQLFLSDLVLTETARNLARKAPEALSLFGAVVEALTPAVVRPSREQVLMVAQVVELKDAPIVAGALEADAPYLATYDQQHLLRVTAQIREAFGITVATPAEILRLTAEDHSR